MSHPPRRRSKRQQARHNDDTSPLTRWRDFSQVWRQQYIDLGHCRIAKCMRRLIDASGGERDDLRSMGISFVALAITAAASTSGRTRMQKEQDLMEYIHAAHDRNLPVNDSHRGGSAVELAAYHGLSTILVFLLDTAGSPLKNSTSQKNAIFSAIRNGQHNALDIILRKRRSESFRIIREEATRRTTSGFIASALSETIMKGDVVSAQLLLSSGCALMSDVDAHFLFYDTKRFKRHTKLQKLIQSLYPECANVLHWQKKLHWSFPKTDRDTLHWLWHVLHHQSNKEIIPDEMWLRVFSFFGRGWFASRMYDSISSSGADVVETNIIGS